MIEELNENNFDKKIKDGIKLVVFSTDWCVFCKKQKPILEELSNENVWIGNVDADKNTSIVNSLGITGFPSFVLFKDGKPFANFSGYKDKYSLLDILIKALQ